MDPELERKLERMERMIEYLVAQQEGVTGLEFGNIRKTFEPPPISRPDVWDEQKSKEAEAKKKHIQKHSKLQPKEKGARIAELTKKAFVGE